MGMMVIVLINEGNAGFVSSTVFPGHLSFSADPRDLSQLVSPSFATSSNPGP